MSRWIDRAWQRYRTVLIPPEAEQVQIDETRQAFFAGAAVLFAALMNSVSEGDKIQEADERLMADLQAEMDEFGQEMDLKAFGGTKQ